MRLNLMQRTAREVMTKFLEEDVMTIRKPGPLLAHVFASIYSWVMGYCLR